LKERNTTNNKKAENQRFKVAHKIVQFLCDTYSFVPSAFNPGYIDIRPFTWDGFSANVLYTYSGSISNSKKVIDNFDTDIKRRIKKAKAKEYQIKTGLAEDQIIDFYRLQEITYKRQNHVFYLSQDKFTRFLKNLGGEIFDIYSLYSDSKPVFSQIIVKDGNTAYYWLAAGNPEYYNTGFNQLLFEYMIDDLSKNGFIKFDFLGANTGTISKYKSTYNFSLVPYYSVNKVNSKLLNLLLFLKGKK
jgi:lipid II:glycine glycyltransferase (peptidoglycan interpeptide bridge formation enzyme)